jgi:hypothetical protein
MKYLLTSLILLTGCASIDRITHGGFEAPPVLSQPDIIEPISASIDNNTPVDLEQTNDVFVSLTMLVVVICMLSVLPTLITYLRTRLGRDPND